MGTRSSARIRIKHRSVSSSSVPHQEYHYLPWMEEQYSECPWYAVTLTSEQLLLAGKRLKESRKGKGFFDSAIKLIASAGLRSREYFWVSESGHIGARDEDCAVENIRRMLDSTPDRQLEITVPGEFTLAAFPDRITLSSWQQDGKGESRFHPVYTIRFVPDRPSMRDHESDYERVPYKITEDVYPGFNELAESAGLSELIWSALHLPYDYFLSHKKL